MRLLMVTNTYPTPDRPHAGAVVYTQVMGLRRLGVDVSILCLERERLGPLVYWSADASIRRAATDTKAELVHVQFGGVQAMQAVRAFGRRTVITFHGTDLHGGWPKTLTQSLRYSLGRWCSRWAAKRAGWSIVVSQNLLPHLADLTDRVSVIPTGVDFELFQPMLREEAVAKLSLDPSKKYVLFCDNGHDPVKRRDLAERAVRHASQIIPGLELLELHRVAHQDVPLYLNAAVCLIVTSEKEGSPNIVKEALACNIPVVSVDVGDVAIRLNGVRNCVIVPRDPEQIGKAVIKTVCNGGRSNGREVARQSIDNEIVCRAVLRVYERVLEGVDRASPDILRRAVEGL